jgi:hypothetical protein
MSLLMARRMVEAGVPFITVFWKEDEGLHKKCKSAGGWDTHGNNFNCLRENLLPQFDRCFSAFLEDLSSRGLLDETLVLVTSEMGRMPKVGDRRSGGPLGAGRDHWTACMSVLMAGAGIQRRAGRRRNRCTRRIPEGPADLPRGHHEDRLLRHGHRQPRSQRPTSAAPTTCSMKASRSKPGIGTSRSRQPDGNGVVWLQHLPAAKRHLGVKRRG